jgi:hypothetical protein
MMVTLATNKNSLKNTASLILAILFPRCASDIVIIQPNSHSEAISSFPDTWRTWEELSICNVLQIVEAPTQAHTCKSHLKVKSHLLLNIQSSYFANHSYFAELLASSLYIFVSPGLWDISQTILHRPGMWQMQSQWNKYLLRYICECTSSLELLPQNSAIWVPETHLWTGAPTGIQYLGSAVTGHGWRGTEASRL